MLAYIHRRESIPPWRGTSFVKGRLIMENGECEMENGSFKKSNLEGPGQ